MNSRLKVVKVGFNVARLLTGRKRDIVRKSPMPVVMLKLDINMHQANFLDIYIFYNILTHPRQVVG